MGLSGVIMKPTFIGLAVALIALTGCAHNTAKQAEIAVVTMRAQAQAKLESTITADFAASRSVVSACVALNPQVSTNSASAQEVSACSVHYALQAAAFSLKCGNSDVIDGQMYVSGEDSQAVSIRGYLVDQSSNGQRVRLKGEINKKNAILQLQTEVRQVFPGESLTAVNPNVVGPFRLVRNVAGDGWMGARHKLYSRTWCTLAAKEKGPTIRLSPSVDADVLTALSPISPTGAIVKNDVSMNLDELALWLDRLPIARQTSAKAAYERGLLLHSIGIKKWDPSYSISFEAAALRYFVAAADLGQIASLDAAAARRIRTSRVMGLNPRFKLEFYPEATRLEARAEPEFSAAVRICSAADAKRAATPLLPPGSTSVEIRAVDLVRATGPFVCRYAVKLPKNQSALPPRAEYSPWSSDRDAEEVDAYNTGRAIGGLYLALRDMVTPDPEAWVDFLATPGERGAFAIKNPQNGQIVATVKASQ
jgi:hypothetical protein